MMDDVRRFRKAIVFGDRSTADHPLVQSFVKSGDVLGGGPPKVWDKISKVQEETEGSPSESLVLLTAGPNTIQQVERLSGRGCTVVVFDGRPFEHLTVDLAIKCLNTGAADFWAADEIEPRDASRRIHALRNPTRIYTEFHPRQSLKMPFAGKPAVFMATPFERKQLETMQQGSIALLNDWDVRWGDQSLHIGHSVGRKLAGEIRGVDLMIANLASADPITWRQIANVYYEIGLAAAKGVPILGVRPRLESISENPVPVDIADEYFVFDGPMHLALTLHFGLKHLFKPHASASQGNDSRH
jgi:hypothetical protein